MNTQIRQISFIGGCLAVRSYLAYLAYTGENNQLMISMFTIMGITTIGLWLTSSRQRAYEGGGVTWWDPIRPIHGALYLNYAIAAYKNIPEAYLWLVMDVLFGGWVFLIKHVDI